MTHAYSELYIEDFQNSFAEAMDYVTEGCGISMKEFYDRFLSSGVDDQIERGNPYYLAGLSGREIAVRIFEKTGGTLPNLQDFVYYPGPEYWTGWALTYLQWYSAYSFSFLADNGFDAESVFLKFHPYHEAPLMKFVDESLELIKERSLAKQSPLKRLRLSSGLTQKELSERSGVKLRMIQAYEQRYQNILKAESGTLLSLARALGCQNPSALLTE